MAQRCGQRMARAAAIPVTAWRSVEHKEAQNSRLAGFGAMLAASVSREPPPRRCARFATRDFGAVSSGRRSQAIPEPPALGGLVLNAHAMVFRVARPGEARTAVFARRMEDS
ncbi:hypothetical protein predicted by Glimmer/Critica [Sorangium cellulosum So ce56]|uniref:Uncharacterized protein n=1 Tax=Sorangium cellulosum (strain So ce56) TaxID=448385 RepID=A9GKR2_SORC5|nr:hypothetical protein predicted by Glimmer/Critica [Sorangium cellulosum So ce56]